MRVFLYRISLQYIGTLMTRQRAQSYLYKPFTSIWSFYLQEDALAWTGSWAEGPELMPKSKPSLFTAHNIFTWLQFCGQRHQLCQGKNCPHHQIEEMKHYFPEIRNATLLRSCLSAAYGAFRIKRKKPLAVSRKRSNFTIVKHHQPALSSLAHSSKSMYGSRQDKSLVGDTNQARCPRKRK